MSKTKKHVWRLMGSHWHAWAEGSNSCECGAFKSGPIQLVANDYDEQDEVPKDDHKPICHTCAVAANAVVDETRTKGVDIFYALDCMFRGQLPKKFPSPWILHRFLAWDKDYAKAAKEVQANVDFADDMFKVWMALVRPQRLRRAPRLKYVGPKNQPSAKGLVAALMSRKKVRREVAEQMAELIELQGKADEVRKEFGVDPDEEE